MSYGNITWTPKPSKCSWNVTHEKEKTVESNASSTSQCMWYLFETSGLH